MITRNRALFSALLLFFTAASFAALPDEVNGQPLPSLAPLVEATSPAVVNIRVRQTVTTRSPFGDDAFRRFFGLPEMPGGSQQVQSAGSGVIVDADKGYIITNHHVVENADEIRISTHDGVEHVAEVVGSDPATDIAVLRVEADGLIDMPIGDSDTVRVGDFVIAIGNPFGLGHTVTSGIVSALGRTGIGEGLEDFIQTDASINPGNSGGALVNMRGELVGINSAIISRTGGNVGIGFAVPTEIAESIMLQLLDYGEVRRGLLGVTINALDAEAAKALNAPVDNGAIISEVVPGSAAEAAGLQVQDIIVEVNSKKITNARELSTAIQLLTPGEKVNIRYFRDGKQRRTTAELGQQVTTTIAGADIHPGLTGAQFATAATASAGGIEVSSVETNSPAAQRGLRSGDVITAVNRRRVTTIQQLSDIARNNRILFLLVQRGDRSLMLQIR
jgi:serine protease Do/serine protease DegQ